MNKQELTNLITEILTQMHPDQPQVRAAITNPPIPAPSPRQTAITAVNSSRILRNLTFAGSI